MKQAIKSKLNFFPWPAPSQAPYSRTSEIKSGDNAMKISVTVIPLKHRRTATGPNEFYMTEHNQKRLVRKMMENWERFGFIEPLDKWCNLLINCCLTGLREYGEPWDGCPQRFNQRLRLLGLYDLLKDEHLIISIPPERARGFSDIPHENGAQRKKLDSSQWPIVRPETSEYYSHETGIGDTREKEVQEYFAKTCEEYDVATFHDQTKARILAYNTIDMLRSAREGTDIEASKISQNKLLTDALGFSRKRTDSSSRKAQAGTIVQLVQLYEKCVEAGPMEELEELWVVEELKMLARKADRRLPNKNPEISDMHLMSLIGIGVADLRKRLKDEGVDPYDPPDPRIQKLEKELAGISAKVMNE